MENIAFSGHMIAVMAMMEAPFILVGVLLISVYDKENPQELSIANIIRHSITNLQLVFPFTFT